MRSQKSRAWDVPALLGLLDDPLYADRRNFYKVEKWSRDGQRIEEMLFAGNSIAKAQRIFERFIQRRPTPGPMPTVCGLIAHSPPPGSARRTLLITIVRTSVRTSSRYCGRDVTACNNLNATTCRGLDGHKKEPRAVNAAEVRKSVASACRLFYPGGDCRRMGCRPDWPTNRR